MRASSRAVHDIKAARTRGMIDALEEARREVLGGKDYRGADGTGGCLTGGRL